MNSTALNRAKSFRPPLAGVVGVFCIGSFMRLSPEANGRATFRSSSLRFYPGGPPRASLQVDVVTPAVGLHLDRDPRRERRLVLRGQAGAGDDHDVLPGRQRFGECVMAVRP